MKKINYLKQIAIILFIIVIGLAILIKIYGEHSALTISAGLLAASSIILLITSEVKKTKTPIRPFRMFFIAILILGIVVFITYLFRDSKYIKIIVAFPLIVFGIGYEINKRKKIK